MTSPAYYLIILSILLLSFQLSAQNCEGFIFDENRNPLGDATIIGMKVDSSMASFSISEDNGSFTLETKDVALIQISYIGYETKWISIDPKAPENLDLGEINMQVNQKQLDAVHIEANQNRLQLNGDTVNYSTAHLTMRPGDVVEDILDQLPGVEVQPDGSVKAFGEDVQNVLVDGEPFFGKDTRMATKNLAAEAVDKVQVFDKTSDFTDFTGVADGREEKSINLELKEDFKNGHFGRMEAGHGDQGRYTARGNLNRFGKKHRTSFIGLSNNRNEPGFTIEQYFEFMGGLESFTRDGGRIEIDLNDQVGLPVGNNNEPGIHTKATLGINYTGNWSKHLKSQFHYLTNYNQQDLKERITQSSLIDQDILSLTDTSNSNNQSHFHNAYWKSTYAPNDQQKLTFSLNASLGFEDISRNSVQLSNTTESEFVSNIRTANDQKGRSSVLVSNLDYKHRFQNKHSLLSSLRATYHTKNQDIFQDLLTNWNQGVNDNQFIKQGYNMSNSIANLNSNYIWPITKRWTADIGLAANAKRHNLQRPWFFDSLSRENIQPVSELSGDVTNSVVSATPSIKLRYTQETWNMTMTLGHNSQQQNVEFESETTSRLKTYHTWLPKVYSRWELGQSHSLNFEFFTDLILPTAEQLQETPNYIDPNNLYIGNPDLNAMLRYESGVSYFQYSQWYDATTYARISAGYVHNQINHLTTTDSLLRQQFTPVNTEFMRNVSIRGEHSRPLGFWNINARIKGTYSYENGSIFIQQLENEIQKHYWKLHFGIGHRKVKKWKWGLAYELSQNHTLFSINTLFNQQFGKQAAKASLEYLPSDSWNIKLNGSWEVFDNPLNIPSNDLTLINASVTRYLGTNRQYRISFNIHDILNQNTGINRWAEGNAVIDQRFNNLGRHVMLTLGYNIRGHKKADNGVINIRVGEE